MIMWELLLFCFCCCLIKKVEIWKCLNVAKLWIRQRRYKKTVCSLIVGCFESHHITTRRTLHLLSLYALEILLDAYQFVGFSKSALLVFEISVLTHMNLEAIRKTRDRRVNSCNYALINLA